ncbi:proteasome-type protease [Methylotenera sp.]|jgi:putative proteasome-type protease|uniref:proteasome-type protease n=1 Tax=Methylotenera sp. TaxID=2051956 RepID=UPI00271E69E6|nr:proteasome-type protease [Methylotenera sp.]MDO9205022.1 proteasome-type protease [Methylotenera sp.]MDP2229337.1 proteasome-type protease [Methylotenera sp.]MDP3142004.1 proteasome-type protease [Methylotenera sp.]MDP3307890.1 proteasome-type protease [Methylotenera sp.]
MTYCVGILLESGLVMASDTRTNAGVDQVATFPKMTTFEVPGERSMVMLTAGNLAVTQAVLQHLHKAIDADDEVNLLKVSNMFDAARIIGAAIRTVHREDAEYLRHHNTDFNISVLFAGQILGERPRLFNIYSAGNFIEASQETPYFQTGETKYGKPILDRVINYNCSLEDALKCVLISFDSTIRSNVSVDLPVDVLVYRKDKLIIDYRHRVAKDDPYFLSVRQHWGEGLRKVFAEIPNPDWC